MATFAIKQFGGIMPKVPARYLQDTQAQTALNIGSINTSLQPLKNVGATVHTLTKTGVPLTIYRFGQGEPCDSLYWFHWPFDVDVARSQIPGDTSEWTFYTGDGAPKGTYAAIALSGSNFPTQSRPLGLPAPATAVTATSDGTGTQTDLPETRVYTWTWVNKEAGFEFESAPAPPSNKVDVKVGETVTLSLFDAAPGGAYIATHRRIYRATSGIYLYVGEIPIASTTFADTVSAEDLGEELPSLTWEIPPATLAGLINMPNGIMAGFTGRDIYFCEPYRPHAWPIEYMQSIDFPIVGLGRMDTTLAVLTKGTPYFIQGSHPDSMVVVKSDIEQACVSKRSIVSAGGVVLYASPDGLIMLSPSGSKNITETYFTKEQWQAFFAPNSIHAYQFEQKYIAFYDRGAGNNGGFIYDLVTGQFILHNIYATAGYNELQCDDLFLAFADRSVKKWLAGSALSYIWRSKKFTMPQIMFFSCAQLEAEAYPVTMKFYADDALIHTQVVANREPFRLPVAPGRDWEVQVEGNSEIFSLVIAQSMAELAGG
jgi:hypothetical protein